MGTLKGLAGTGIGKLLLWVIAALVVALIAAGVWVALLKADVRIARSDLNATQIQRDAVVGQLMQNHDDYQRRLEESKRNSPVITKRYYMTIQNIEKGADQNETCDEAMRALDATDF